MNDDLQNGFNGAFMRDGFGKPPPVEAGGARLAGLRLAVKDVFEVEGLRLGAGNPAWLAQRGAATFTASSVRLLLEAGATWVGKTVTDELTYSLAGINDHYGTPQNPAAAGRIPGGSSSGSAVAVAARFADIGLGTDCGGSIRLPASYCGIWGFRPTHGRVAIDGCITLAPSFDTLGGAARPPAVCAPNLLVPQFMLDLLTPAVGEAFAALLGRLGRAAPVGACLADRNTIQSWAAAFRVIQAGQAWREHAGWLESNWDNLGAAVGARFASARQVAPDAVERAALVRRQAVETLDSLLEKPGAFLILPTVSAPAPPVGSASDAIDTVRAQAQEMLCLAGLAGLPQATMPWIVDDGAPVGLSVIGARGRDEDVLAAATWLHSGFIRTPAQEAAGNRNRQEHRLQTKDDTPQPTD
jgi:amidase